MTTTTTIHDLSPTTPTMPRRSSAALQRTAGLAGLVKAGTYLTGFGLLGAYLVPRGFLDAQGDPDAALRFLLDHQVVMYGWYLVLYLVGGVALVGLVLGVRDRLREAPALARTAEVFGHVWAGLLLASGMVHLVGQQAVAALAADDPTRAATMWATVSVVRDALGGGIEIVGVLWVFLVGVAAVRTRAFSLGIGVSAIAIGSAGVWTLLPVAADGAAALFGLGMIVWFVAVGVSLLRGADRA